MQELQKMRAEYEKYKQGQNTSIIPLPNQPVTNTDTGLPREANIVPYTLQNRFINDSLNVGLKYFGYDFFTRRDTVSFFENLPAQAKYQLGPGDELIISLWGQTQIRKEYIISRDGKIYDEKVGLLNLSGKNIEKAKEYLTNQFGRVYSTLKGQNPSTYIDISLGELRSINVNIVGEVNYPGVYPVHPFSTIITGLVQAGGVDTTGSLRNLQIIREGEVQTTLDLYDYLLMGVSPENIQLRDKDVVFVPTRLYTVTIDSFVWRPGIYESKPNETIAQLIEYSGGLKPNASTIIGLKRILPISKRDTSKSTIENYYINYNNSELYNTQDGDRLTVYSIPETVMRVELSGQVKRPGEYYFYEGMKLIDLIELGGGFNDTTFWKSIYHNKGELIRRNSKSRYETVTKVNLNNIYNGDEGNIKLHNLDRFIVHANLNFFKKDDVKIIGEVNVPGSYSLISDNETLESLIARAGELTPKALKNGISIYRDKKYFEIIETQDPSVITSETDNNISKVDDISINDNYISDNENNLNIKSEKVRVAWKNNKIILMPGDSIVIKEITGTVNVAGEVYSPGLVEYQSGKNLRYYLNSAGGINNIGSKKSIIIVYPNGLIKPRRWYFDPKVEDGSTIIVNRKSNLEPFNITDFAKNWTSIISSAITVVILSKQISSGS